MLSLFIGRGEYFQQIIAQLFGIVRVLLIEFCFAHIPLLCGMGRWRLTSGKINVLKILGIANKEKIKYFFFQNIPFVGDRKGKNRSNGHGETTTNLE